MLWSGLSLLDTVGPAVDGTTDALLATDKGSGKVYWAKPSAGVTKSAGADVCAVCWKQAQTVCGDCGEPYCSRACQREAWPEHRQRCAPYRRAAPDSPRRKAEPSTPAWAAGAELAPEFVQVLQRGRVRPRPDALPALVLPGGTFDPVALELLEDWGLPRPLDDEVGEDGMPRFPKLWDGLPPVLKVVHPTGVPLQGVNGESPVLVPNPGAALRNGPAGWRGALGVCPADKPGYCWLIGFNKAQPVMATLQGGVEHLLSPEVLDAAVSAVLGATPLSAEQKALRNASPDEKRKAKAVAEAKKAQKDKQERGATKPLPWTPIGGKAQLTSGPSLWNGRVEFKVDADEIRRLFPVGIGRLSVTAVEPETGGDLRIVTEHGRAVQLSVALQALKSAGKESGLELTPAIVAAALEDLDANVLTPAVLEQLSKPDAATGAPLFFPRKEEKLRAERYADPKATAVLGPAGKLEPVEEWLVALRHLKNVPERLRCAAIRLRFLDDCDACSEELVKVDAALRELMASTALAQYLQVALRVLEATGDQGVVEAAEIDFATLGRTKCPGLVLASERRRGATDLTVLQLIVHVAEQAGFGDLAAGFTALPNSPGWNEVEERVVQLRRDVATVRVEALAEVGEEFDGGRADIEWRRVCRPLAEAMPAHLDVISRSALRVAGAWDEASQYFGYANFFESMRGFVAEVGQARAAPGWAELHQELAASLPKLAAPPPVIEPVLSEEDEELLLQRQEAAESRNRPFDYETERAKLLKLKKGALA